MTQARSRLRYLLAALACVGLGLATRPLKAVNDGLASALGDGLYAVLAYLLLALAFPRTRPVSLLLTATVLCWLIEVSQLWHTPGLDAVRHTTLGALAIGGTFSLGDCVCYAAGSASVFLIETLLRRRARFRH